MTLKQITSRISGGPQKKWASAAVIKWSSHTTTHHKRNTREPGTTNNRTGSSAQSTGGTQRSLDTNLQSHTADLPERTARNGKQTTNLLLRHNRRAHGQSEMGCRHATNGARRNGRDIEGDSFRTYPADPPQLFLSSVIIDIAACSVISRMSGGLDLVGRIVGRGTKYVRAQIVTIDGAKGCLFECSAIFSRDTPFLFPFIDSLHCDAAQVGYFTHSKQAFCEVFYFHG